jgi:hypothetical protein
MHCVQHGGRKVVILRVGGWERLHTHLDTRRISPSRAVPKHCRAASLFGCCWEAIGVFARS